ncbi:hypothetical protein [Actinomadura rayongensis]|uniref:Uncharacterized protein n=1 Tax=Actinomadura rayongensis TaxID=1429076 RepID=A0A6I4W7X4_9ACTN|nr:hypothetical protein [Actinomadura rayongensis]MXQ63254.1 hypothetical protein [Actinomadura rayongensis]
MTMTTAAPERLRRAALVRRTRRDAQIRAARVRRVLLAPVRPGELPEHRVRER